MITIIFKIASQKSKIRFGLDVDRIKGNTFFHLANKKAIPWVSLGYPEFNLRANQNRMTKIASVVIETNKISEIQLGDQRKDLPVKQNLL